MLQAYLHRCTHLHSDTANIVPCSVSYNDPSVATAWPPLRFVPAMSPTFDEGLLGVSPHQVVGRLLTQVK